MNTKRIISSVGVGAGAIILGLGIQYAMASWTSAPASPPNSNVAAPINVSGGGENGTTVYSQTKTGLLTLENLVAVNLNVASGTVTTAGSVLTNDGAGNASWQALTGGGGTYTVSPTWSNNVVCPVDGTFNNPGTNSTGASNDLNWLCSGGYATGVADGAHTPTNTSNPMLCTNGPWVLNTNTNGNLNFYCVGTTGKVTAMCSSNYTCSPNSTTTYSTSQGIYCNWNGDFDFTGQGVSTDTHIQCESNHVFSMNQGNQAQPTYVQLYNLVSY